MNSSSTYDVGVGGPIEVDEHARVDAEVLAGLQGVGEPVEVVGRHREEDLVHDHVFLEQVGKILEGSDDRNAGDAPDRLGRIHGEAAPHQPAGLGITPE